MRLRAIRDSGRELTEEEENSLPGCAYCINSQTANYCFFKFASDLLDKPLSDAEIAHYNNISIESVKVIEKSALNKLINSKYVKELKELLNGEGIVADRDDDSMFSVSSTKKRY